MTFAYSILSQIQQAMSFFAHSLDAPEGLYLHHSAARLQSLHRQYLFSKSNRIGDTVIHSTNFNPV